MKAEQPNNESYHSPSSIVLPPVNELLAYPDYAALAGGNDPALTEQVSKHAEQISSIETVIDKLPSPTTPLETAVAEEAISEAEAAGFYDALSSMLEDSDTARLALYVPFEAMPRSEWFPESQDLQDAIDRFRNTYLDAWYNLLSIHDVRANFVDGDVLEESYRVGDLPRVVKAAHLIPQLLKSRMITTEDIMHIEHATDDPVLLQSIAEARQAMHTKRRIQADAEYVPIPDNVSDRRREWLLGQRREKAIKTAGRTIAGAILDYKPVPTVLTEALTHTQSAETLTEGIYQAIVHAAASSPEQAALLYSHYRQTLLSLEKSEDANVQQRVTQTFRRLHHLGLVSEEKMSELGIVLPRLSGQLSENLALLPHDIAALQRITASVEADPELNEYVYPVALLGGSRLKGYGESDSDVDVSVFIKPGTPAHFKPRLRELLASAYQNGDQQYEPIEFWLDETASGQLQVRTFDPIDAHTADAYWTHLLFGGAWIGNKEAISGLRQQLLPNYFDKSDPARRLYLECLEQDTLQYRLMHKGYARHFPALPREPWTHSETVDGDSMFWDSGYRWLATRLFAEKVFLPKL